MKFTASSADLLKALTIVNGAVPSKSSLPILENILLTADGEGLRLSATDLEISIVEHIEVKVESSRGVERVAVPAKRLLDTLRALPDVQIVVEADEEFNVVLSTEYGQYKMVGHDGADYPALPELDVKSRIETSGRLLKRAVTKTSFAVSRDALRPAMMGIYFQIGSEGGRAVATDGHRLVKLDLSELTADQDITFIVPEKALSIAARIAAEGSCTIAVANGYIEIDFGYSRVIARLIDESYPNYEAVIPLDNDRRLLVSRDQMQAAVKRVGLYSSSMTNQIRLALKPDEIEISAEDIERSSEAREVIRCDYQAEEMVIGFNSVYLTEVLNNIDDDEVSFEFSSPNRAGVVTPAQQDDGERMLMLIMPVMLNTYA
jgi:DNA polymerase III subunit beta